MDFFLEVDEKQTKKNAKAVLQQYQKLKRIAGAYYSSLQSPKLSLANVQNSKNQDSILEKAVVRKVEAQQELTKIDEALNSLPDLEKEILSLSLCSLEKHTNDFIADTLGYCRRSIDRYKSMALLSFAETYKDGECMVFKS